MPVTREMRTLREAVLAAALLLGVLHSSSCITFKVQDSSNNTCILADLAANFTVEYNTVDKKEKASFMLPEQAVVDSSSTCGKQNTFAPLLAIKFGKNHSLSINFTKSNVSYQVDELVFAYNLNDKIFFPDSSENVTNKVSSKNSLISAKANTTYHCSNPHVIIMENVNITFHDVKLEAYLTNNTYSKTETHCSEDVSPTSAPPTKPVPTKPVPTTTPVTPQTPDVGTYRINGTSGAACILANMGLKLHFNYTKKDDKLQVATYEYNIDPKNVSVQGRCINSSATLILFSDAIYLLFNFTLNTSANQFYLGQVHVNTTALPDAKDPFIQGSDGLSFLQTTEHKSYKCNAKQNFQITSNFSLDTYNLQIQVFDMDDSKFGPAIECAADQNGMLVPIIVGAALAGLVLIVLIAYLIGRKRNHAGYQTI